MADPFVRAIRGSACSFIALRAAQIAAGPDLLTAEQIGRAVRQGVQDHQESMQRGLLQVEHASVDEALHARNAAAGTDATPVPVLHEAFVRRGAVCVCRGVACAR